MTDDQTTDQGDDAAGSTGQGADSGDQGGKPAETDWKAEARKWESRATANKRLADERAAAAAELETLKAASATDQEKAVAAARAEERQAVTTTLQQRVLRSEIRAAAGGRFHDPADAVTQLDLESFTPDEHGDFDEKSIRSALDDLLKRKPYLAKTDDRRFTGGADQGARGGGKQTLDEQITEAESKGDGRLARSLKAQKLSALPHS